MRTLIVPSIIFNLQRAVSAGITLNLIFLCFLLADVISGGTGSASFASEFSSPTEMVGGIAGFAIAMLIAPIIYMPVGLVAAWLRRQIGQVSFNSIFDVITLMFAAVTGWTSLACLIVLMLGDPGVLLLKRIAPDFVPVDRPKFWNPHLFITVQGDPDELRALREEARLQREDARARHEEQARSIASSDRAATHQDREVSTQPSADDDDVDDNILRELTTTDRDPRRGLEYIDNLSAPLRHRPMVMFSRFVGLRKIALRGVFESELDENAIFTADTDKLAALITSDELSIAKDALREVAELQRRHPGYVDRLGDADDRFAARMVDDVCAIVERLTPTEVGRLLGWTKLMFLGNDRVGFGPGILRDIPIETHTATMKARIPVTRPFQSAAAALTGETERGRYVDFVLMERQFRQVEGSLEQAGILDTVRIFNDGTVISLQAGTDDSAASTLSESKRQELLDESRMLLNYEDDPEKIQFLRASIAWLEGRGPRPSQQSRTESRRSERLADPPQARTAGSGGGFARAALIFILIIAASGAAFFFWQSSQRPVQADAGLDPNHFEVLPYAAQQTIVARESELNIRALPFARPDVPILRESAAGEILNVTGLVRQEDGDWYQIRLAGGQVGYFKASLAVPQSEYMSSSAAGPPLTNGFYVQQGVCPFEGCVYRQWRATASTRLHREPDDTSEVVATVLAGEVVSALTGEVHISPLSGRVIRSLGEFRAGDTVYRLSYRGEGTWDVWHNGKVADAYNLDYWSNDPVFDFGPNANSASQSTWWVRIQRSNGETGWSRETDNFEGKDQFG